MHTKFWSENDKGKQFWRPRNIRHNNNGIGLEVVVRMKTGLSWLRIGKITNTLKPLNIKCRRPSLPPTIARSTVQWNFAGFLRLAVKLLCSDIKETSAFESVMIHHHRYFHSLTVSFSGKLLPNSIYRYFKNLYFRRNCRPIKFLCTFLLSLLKSKSSTRLLKKLEWYIIYDLDLQ
jgi:hypothetical protein